MKARAGRLSHRLPRYRLARRLCVAVVVLAAFATSSTGSAATLTVNDPADTISAASCTLRAAALAVSTGAVAGTGCTNTGGAFGTSDLIQMAPAIDTISLSDTADNDIVITAIGNVTIEGRAAGAITVIAGPLPASRVNFFRVITYTGAGTLTLRRVALGNGAINATSLRSGGGGGVYSNGSLALDNTYISTNSTNCTGCPGGGVYALQDLTIANSVLMSNETLGANSPGGAAAVFGALADIEAAAFIANTTQGANATGGGVHLQTTTSRIQSSVFASNQTGGADAYGGGFYATGALELTHAYFVANTAKTQGGAGMAASTAVIRDASFIGNVVSNYIPAGGAARGGALSLFGPSNTVINSTFNNNAATSTVANAGLGGALWVRVHLDIANSTIEGNSTTGLGGGVFFNDAGASATFNSTIVANSVSQSAASPQPDIDIHNNSGYLSISGSNNLIQHGASIGVPAGTFVTAPMLGAAADNGCATPAGATAFGSSYSACPATQRPQPGSPVIDAGNNAKGLTTDQRGVGFARVVGAAADMGAIEGIAAAAADSATPVPTLSKGALLLLMATLGLAAAGMSMRRRR